MLSAKTEKREEEETQENVPIDRTIVFTQLSAPTSTGATENLFDASLSQALGTAPKSDKFDFSSSKLGKVLVSRTVVEEYV